ncbi:MAG: hypothetical protein Q9214_001057 [Letrouitia sp. 1 TL-2023]
MLRYRRLERTPREDKEFRGDYNKLLEKSGNRGSGGIVQDSLNGSETPHSRWVDVGASRTRFFRARPAERSQEDMAGPQERQPVVMAPMLLGSSKEGKLTNTTCEQGEQGEQQVSRQSNPASKTG